jgi:hypothetical protein
MLLQQGCDYTIRDGRFQVKLHIEFRNIQSNYECGLDRLTIVKPWNIPIQFPVYSNHLTSIHEVALVIDGVKEQLLPARRLQGDQTTQVCMHQVKQVRRMVLAGCRERMSSLLPGQAALADLVDVVDRR